MYRQGGSYHSSNGDQLGRAGRRRQSFRRTAREGATTAQMETNWAGQEGGGRVREGATTAQTETNWAGQGGGGRLSGVQPGREPPQLKRRPTGQGREEEAESRCTAREGATTDNSRSRGRRQRRSTPVHRCEIEQISCNLTGTRRSPYVFFLFFFFSFSFFF